MPKVNLVPREEKAREFRRQVYIFPIAGAVLLIAALGGSYVYYSNQVDNAQQELSDAQASNQTLAPQLAELQKYENVTSQKDNKQSGVKSIYDQRIRWSRILDDLSFVIPNDIWLNSLQAAVPGKQVTVGGSSPSVSGGTGTTPDIVIDGYTHDNSMPSVATFLIRLGLLPALQNVTLINASTEKQGSTLVIHFQIGANLKSASDINQAYGTSSGGGYTPTLLTPTQTTPTGGTPAPPSSTGSTITTPTSSSGGTGAGGITP